MAETAANWTGFDETVVFLRHFNDLKDPRQQGKADYPLAEILLLFCLIAVLAGAETITDIGLLGRKKLDLLRRFRPFANGTPARSPSWRYPRLCWTTSSSSAASSPG